MAYASPFLMSGVINLCRGLRTNSTLRQLHLCYCQIMNDAAVAISELLENARSNLEVLNLTGNRLGGLGLQALCRGLMANTKCQHLGLADNMIDQVSPVLVYSLFILLVLLLHLFIIIIYFYDNYLCLH